ncbi:MAG: hypothetical protein K2Y14_01270 [Burkholderiales bacterium]|nr:hypothetical protein [Burkholderiales bacterium]
MAVIVAIISMLILWKLVSAVLKTPSSDDSTINQEAYGHSNKCETNKNYGDYRSTDDMTTNPIYSSVLCNIHNDD